MTQLLGAYEIIVTHATDPDAAAAYLKGTQDLLSQMCLGRDATQPLMIVSSKGSTQPLCVIEAQGLFIDPSIVNRNVSIAALDQKNAAQVRLWTAQSSVPHAVLLLVPSWIRVGRDLHNVVMQWRQEHMYIGLLSDGDLLRVDGHRNDADWRVHVSEWIDDAAE